MIKNQLKKANVVLLLGGNLGDRFQNIINAVNAIKEFVGSIQKKSSLYETAAWGITDQPHFLNQVVVVQTILSAQQVIEKILFIEKQLGRERLVKMGPRIIDIDILFYDDTIIEKENLIIPHPRLQERKFVLEPLNELIPNYIHPILNKSVKVLLQECTDTLNVKKF